MPSCYSVVAIGSIDTGLSVWLPHMKQPQVTALDLFKNAISDISWAFNGNILLACSMDGSAIAMHFEAGILGEPITEYEKQVIIENKYGSTILNEYKKNHKVENRALTNLMESSNTPVVVQ